MWPTATDVVAWSVCMHAQYSGEPCKKPNQSDLEAASCGTAHSHHWQIQLNIQLYHATVHTGVTTHTDAITPISPSATTDEV